jgi:hypothetical protein
MVWVDCAKWEIVSRNGELRQKVERCTLAYIGQPDYADLQGGGGSEAQQHGMRTVRAASWQPFAVTAKGTRRRQHAKSTRCVACVVGLLTQFQMLYFQEDIGTAAMHRSEGLQAPHTGFQPKP